jgi:hypothetical protein
MVGLDRLPQIAVTQDESSWVNRAWFYEHLLQICCHIPNITGFEQYATGGTQGFQRSSNVGDSGCYSTGLRFQDRQGEPFIEGRQTEQIQCLIEAGHLFNVAEKVHSIRKPE